MKKIVKTQYIRQFTLQIVFFLILFTTLFYTNSLFAKTMKPVRVMLPGNFCGNTFAWKEQQRPFPAMCWRLPKLISSLRKQSDYINCVINIGNNSSIFSPASYITSGAIDRYLSTLCLPKLQVLGPKDLGVYHDKGLSQEIRKYLWTNVSTDRDAPLFPPRGLIIEEGFKMQVFSFISKEYVENFPLVKWGNLKVLSPTLALRKQMPKFTKKSITMIIAHLTDKDTSELTKLLNKYKGTFFLVRIAQTWASRLDALPSKFKNVFSFKLSDGCNKLPMIIISRSNFTKPRINVKMIPLKKADNTNVETLFSKVSDKIFNKLNTILRVIPFNVAKPPFRFSPSLYAEFTRDYSRADISILYKPDSDFFLNSVIRNYDLFTICKNDFVYKFRLKGYKLQELILDLVSRSREELIFGGCQFRLFAGSIINFKINHQALLPNRYYSLAVSAKVIRTKKLSALFQQVGYKRNEGITLWNIWQKKLQDIKINSDLLDN